MGRRLFMIANNNKFLSLSFVKRFQSNGVWLIICCMMPLACHCSIYEQGLNAVKQKNFPLAITHFSRFINQGQVDAAELPLVYFNLGVCYYRVEQYDLANTSFRQAMNSDALLWRSVFNLAMVAERQQRWVYAARLYDKIVVDSSQPELIELAKKRRTRMSKELLLLNQQSTSGLLKKSLPLAWTGTVFAGIGRDDEVIDQKDLTGSGSDDSFYEVYAGIYRPMFVNDNRYLLINGLAYSAQYDSVEEFDINLLSAGLEYRWWFDEQLFSTGISLEHSSVGSDDYVFQQSLFASNGWLFNSKAKLVAKYTYRDYQALDSLFDPLAGFSHEFKLTWHSPWVDQQRWRVNVFVLDDDRADRMDDRGRTSFSSLRKGVGLHWSFRDQRWRWIVDLEYRNSDYDGRNSLAREVEKSREDERYQARLSWLYSIMPKWELSLEYEYNENKSNIETYNYHSGVTTGGVSYNF